jgi:hypothetical protein
MRVPRVRFTVRWAMVAVAVLAVLIAALRAATRPIPTVTAVGEDSDGFIYSWSDGAKTRWGERPMEAETQLYPLSRLVKYQDGSMSFRLRLP